MKILYFLHVHALLANPLSYSYLASDEQDEHPQRFHVRLPTRLTLVRSVTMPPGLTPLESNSFEFVTKHYRFFCCRLSIAQISAHSSICNGDMPPHVPFNPRRYVVPSWNSRTHHISLFPFYP